MPSWLDAGRLRSVELDLRGARALHRAVSRPLLLKGLVAFSRLGNGGLWASLIIVLPLADRVNGWHQSLLVLLLGGINLLIYGSLKRITRRKRPFAGGSTPTAY